MAKNTKPKTLYYKLVNMPKGKASLQEELSALLGKNGDCKNVEERVCTPETNSKLQMFINYHETKKGMLCGQFVRLESKHPQPLMARSKGSQYYHVTMINPDQISNDDDSDTDNDFLEQIMYFCVYKNHLALVQSRSVTSRHFEQYLNWMFRQFLNEDGALIISDNPPDDVKDKFINGDVKKIFYGAPVKVSVDSDKSTANNIVYERNNGAKIIDIIRQKADNFLGVTKFDDALNEMNMTVKVEVTYQRQTTEKGFKFLKELANANRHNYDEELDVELKSGAKITGENFKIKEKRNIEVNDSGDINEFQLYQDMVSWLATKLS